MGVPNPLAQSVRVHGNTACLHREGKLSSITVENRTAPSCINNFHRALILCRRRQVRTCDELHPSQTGDQHYDCDSAYKLQPVATPDEVLITNAHFFARGHASVGISIEPPAALTIPNSTLVSALTGCNSVSTFAEVIPPSTVGVVVFRSNHALVLSTKSILPRAITLGGIPCHREY